MVHHACIEWVGALFLLSRERLFSRASDPGVGAAGNETVGSGKILI